MNKIIKIIIKKLIPIIVNNSNNRHTLIAIICYYWDAIIHIHGIYHIYTWYIPKIIGVPDVHFALHRDSDATFQVSSASGTVLRLTSDGTVGNRDRDSQCVSAFQCTTY